MTTPQPRNLFTTNTFISMLTGLIIASTPNIGDMVRNGGSVEKWLYLIASVLSGASVSAEKMKSDKEIYTPVWCPLGQNKSDVIKAEIVTETPLQAPTFVPAPAPTPTPTTTTSIPKAVEAAVQDVTDNPLNLLKIF